MNRSFAVAKLPIIAGLLCLFGCAKSPPPSHNSPGTTNAAAATSDETRECWEVYLMQGKRIGYGHITAHHEVEAGQQIIRTEERNRLAVKRAGQVSKQEVSTVSIETPEGRLIRFESETRMGPNPIVTVGRVRGDQLVLETSGGGHAAPTQSKTAWQADCCGPFAIEQSILRRPMRPGEHRSLKMLMIGFNQPGEAKMTAVGFESVTLLDGTHDLLRIETLIRLGDGQELDGAVWTDRNGKIFKSYSRAMGLESYRVGEAEASKDAGAAELDLLLGTMVKIERPLPNAHRTKQVRYRVHLDGGNPAGVFLAGPTQAVKSIDAETAEITVYAIRPGEAAGNRNALVDKPTDDDLRPNTFIQSDDPVIIADAKTAAGHQTDPWRVAVALESYVYHAVKKKDFTQVLATASEVAKSREGDCTEHALFLAALARARGMPARVAVGLVYVEGLQAMAYHMWAEVYVDRRWIPIDGTLGQGGIGAGHLQVARTSLKDSTAYAAFLPVVQILGRLKIEIVDVQ
jgi:hypothetical protein